MLVVGYIMVLFVVFLSQLCPLIQCTILFSITVEPNGSNTDGSFTMAYLNSFLSPYEFFSDNSNIEGIFLILL